MRPLLGLHGIMYARIDITINFANGVVNIKKEGSHFAFQIVFGINGRSIGTVQSLKLNHSKHQKIE